MCKHDCEICDVVLSRVRKTKERSSLYSIMLYSNDRDEGPGHTERLGLALRVINLYRRLRFPPPVHVVRSIRHVKQERTRSSIISLIPNATNPSLSYIGYLSHKHKGEKSVPPNPNSTAQARRDGQRKKKRQSRYPDL